MDLDAETIEFLQRLADSGRKPLHESTPEEARQRSALLTGLIGPGPEMAAVREVEIAADGGSITIRLLMPAVEADGIIVYYHGGGWVLGDLDGYDTLARQLAARTVCTVALVDYRLAPEYPFPAPVEDSWTALRWVDENRANLARADVPLIVMGDSAGGNLAAVMTQRSRREDGPRIDHQVLIYPVADADVDRPSYIAAPNQLMVDRPAMMWFFDHYAPQVDLRSDPQVSPLRAPDLSGLPPATVLLASNDPLHDEGTAYAAALAAAGVPVQTRTLNGQMHGFFSLVNILPGAAMGMDFVVQQVISVVDPAVADARADAVVIGAGFAGLYMLKRLRDVGLRVRLFEAAEDVGGTWYWNSYPGARCDVESIYYSYSFDRDLEQEWTWTHRYASQSEILSYLRHVADKFALRKDITFGTTVTGATWDDGYGVWRVNCDTGETVRCTYLVSAAGCLSSVQIPRLPGLDDFAGSVVHTARWPADGLELAGRRVAVVGTGSTGIQVIPALAEQAAHVTVFQRTPHFSAPARNRGLSDDEVRRVKNEYPTIRARCRINPAGTELTKSETPAGALTAEEREHVLREKWESGGPGIISVFADVLSNEEANDVVAAFFRNRIAEIVEDPAVTEMLTPSGYPIGAKRICVDTAYYETFNRDNVTLVSVGDTPIQQITENGVMVDGIDYPADILVFATGFDAITGPLNRIDIRGREGALLRNKWTHGPRTYLGVATAGFPNLFTITGPGSPSVLVNMVTAIEHHVEFIADLVTSHRAQGITVIEPTQEAEDDWVDRVNAAADQTLYPRAGSWYMGANIPGKPRVFMPFVGGMGVYRQFCDDVIADGYRGFIGHVGAQSYAEVYPFDGKP